MVNKEFYNTILCLTFSPCGNYLITGDIYGKISVFYLYMLMNPDENAIREEPAKNAFTVQKDVQINSLLSTENYLLVGLVGEVFGYDWNVVKNNKDAKIAWKIEVPSGVKDTFEKSEINCMLKNDSDLTYVGCGDSNIYVINIEIGTIVRTLSGHSDYVHGIFSLGNELASGGEDGVVNIWDLRDKLVVNKIKPYENENIARPELGKWIGAVCINEDWLLCGGGPKLSLWHFRSLTPSTIFPIEDHGIHVAEVVDDKVLAGGRADFFYNMSYNGEIASKIPTSCVTAYSAIHQEDPFKALCIAGSSPKIDICSNFNYKDQVISLM